MVQNRRLEQLLGELEELDARMGAEWLLEECERRARLVGELGQLLGVTPEAGNGLEQRLEQLVERTAQIATGLREQRAQWQNTIQDLEIEKRQLRAFDTEAAASSSLLDRLA